MSCDSLRVSQVLSYCPSTETLQVRAPNRMTDARKHHFDKKFIVARLIEDDRSKSKFGSWLFHNECYCIDILTGCMIRHDVKKDGEIGKWKETALLQSDGGEQLVFPNQYGARFTPESCRNRLSVKVSVRIWPFCTPQIADFRPPQIVLNRLSVRATLDPKCNDVTTSPSIGPILEPDRR